MPFRLYSFVLEDSLESDVKGLLTEMLLFSDLGGFPVLHAKERDEAYRQFLLRLRAYGEQ